MKKQILLILSTFLIFSSIRAQSPANYELLWRIEKPGLPGASYLFGTIHVPDNRAFNFSDSVMKCIEKCDAFAMEVHPDTMVRDLLNETLNNDGDILERYLEKEELDEFKTNMREEHGLDLDKLKIRNPESLKALIKKNRKRSDDRETFVDMYLYGISRTLGKETYGLEKTEDQLDFFSSLSDSAKEESVEELIDLSSLDLTDHLEELIETYATGDLEKIANLLEDEFLYDEKMVKRNEVMIRSMKRLMANQRTFVAVGTAHLLGDVGLITRLREEGYTLTPVEATFTGIADKYKIDPSKMEWYELDMSDLGYTVKMPGMPVKTNIVEGMDMFIYTDAMNRSAYTVYTIDRRGATFRPDEDQMIKNIITNLKNSGNQEILKKKRINFNGYPAMELFLKGNYGLGRMRILNRNNILYCSMIGGSEEVIKGPLADRFFDSFQTTLPKELAPKDWTEFVDDHGAYAVMLPVEAKDVSRDVPNPYEFTGEKIRMHMYMGINTSTMKNYLLAWNDLPPGYYLESSQQTFREMLTMLESTGTIVSDVDTIWQDGAEGREFEMMLQDTYFSKVRIFVRGNRVYKLIKQNLVANNQSISPDGFFDSWRFLPYLPSEVEEITADNETFKITGVPDYYMEVDTANHDLTSYATRADNYFFSNKQTGGVYALEEFYLREYFYAPHRDTFYTNLMSNMLRWNDSLVSTDTINIDGTQGRSILVYDTYENQYSRTSFWLKNDRMYTLSGFLSEDELHNNESELFFNSFERLKKTSDFDYTQKKSTQILDRLSSKDSLEREAAVGALEYYAFDSLDLDGLHGALNNPAIPSGWGVKTVQNTLVNEIGYQSRGSSVGPLKTFYLNSKNHFEQENVLRRLKDIETQEADEAYLDLMVNHLPDTIYNTWGLLPVIYDTTSRFIALMEPLLPVVHNKDLRGSYLDNLNEVIDEDSTQINFANQHKEALLKHVQDDFSDLKAEIAGDPENYHYSANVMSALNLMAHVEYSDVDGFTEEFLKITNNKWQMIRAIRTRLYNNLDVSKKHIKSVLKDPSLLVTLLGALNERKRVDLVPAKYLTDEVVAKSSMIRYLEEDFGVTDDVFVLGKIAEGDYNYFGLKYRYEGETEFYFGVCMMPKSGAITNLGEVKSYTDWSEMPADWRAEARKLVEDTEKYGY